MDWLELFQTIGICVGSVALAMIAFMLFYVGISFFPPRPDEDELDDLEPLVIYAPSSPPGKRPRKNRSGKKASKSGDEPPGNEPPSGA
jgi:hypothetical protein